MPLIYSTACEEVAYSKDAAALVEEADWAFGPEEPPGEKGSFKAGLQFWFKWWGDGYRTSLVFRGTESEVLSRIHGLEDRPMD